MWSVDKCWGETMILCKSLCISSVMTYLIKDNKRLSWVKIIDLTIDISIKADTPLDFYRC